jgi:HD superfamily phosphohydrolase
MEKRNHNDISLTNELEDKIIKEKNEISYEKRLKIYDINQKNFKIFKDTIHGNIEFSKHFLEIIDHPYFQRLRNLKQLGLTNFVYNNANHTRFEHSLGTGYLCIKYLELLKKRNQYIELSEEEISLIGIAGLSHDLGHGPYSHTFEKWIHKEMKNSNWHHENFSCELIEKIINQRNIDIDTSQVNFIKNLICGNHKKDEERMFLYEIVSNSETSIDVDKFDYLERDAFHTGFKINFDSNRIMNVSRIIDGKIAFHRGDAFNLYNLYSNRYLLHSQVYNHKTTIAIELMFYDILSNSEPILKISERPVETLGDEIIYEIQNSKEFGLEKAQKLIKDIYSRNLYKKVCEFLLPNNIDKKEFLTKLTVENIANESVELTPNDFRIFSYDINHALKDKNPLSFIPFFDDWNSNNWFTLKNDEISYFLPIQFIETHFRIYIIDKTKENRAKSAIYRFSKQYNFNFIFNNINL